MTRGERVDARRNNRERSGKPTVACVQPVPCPITSCHGGTPRRLMPDPPLPSSRHARSKARTTLIHAACKRANICTRPRSCVSIDERPGLESASCVLPLRSANTKVQAFEQERAVVIHGLVEPGFKTFVPRIWPMILCANERGCVSWN